MTFTNKPKLVLLPITWPCELTANSNVAFNVIMVMNVTKIVNFFSMVYPNNVGGMRPSQRAARREPNGYAVGRSA